MQEIKKVGETYDLSQKQRGIGLCLIIPVAPRANLWIRLMNDSFALIFVRFSNGYSVSNCHLARWKNLVQNLGSLLCSRSDAVYISRQRRPHASRTAWRMWEERWVHSNSIVMRAPRAPLTTPSRTRRYTGKDNDKISKCEFGVRELSIGETWKCITEIRIDETSIHHADKVFQQNCEELYQLSVWATVYWKPHTHSHTMLCVYTRLCFTKIKRHKEQQLKSTARRIYKKCGCCYFKSNWSKEWTRNI